MTRIKSVNEMTHDELVQEHHLKKPDMRVHYAKAKERALRTPEENAKLRDLMKQLYGFE